MLGLLFALAICYSQSQNDSTKHWVGTWACAPYAAQNNTPPNPPGLQNNSLRQIIRISVGSDTIRLRFSNVSSPSPVTLQKVTIAESAGGSRINSGTLKTLKFNGSESVTMEARGFALSDVMDYPLKENMLLAITIYYGQCDISPEMTHHYGSRTDSYIMTGDQSENPDFGNQATIIERWYHINTVEIWAPKSTRTVVVLGNSITDGYGLHGGLKNRWTDVFSRALLANDDTKQAAVVNMGIGATNVASGANSGLARFQQDVLDMPGMHWIIIYYGVNDIGADAPASEIIDAYQSMIADAHAQDTAIKVYGVTITPIKNSIYWSDAHEQVRSEVNAWIRTEGNFDGLIDFDWLIRFPGDTTVIISDLTEDYLHPNARGLEWMGKNVDLRMFFPPLPPVVESVKPSLPFTGFSLKDVYIKGNNIWINLQKDSNLGLKIFDLSGKLMWEHEPKSFMEGPQQFSLHDTKLGSGGYLFEMTVNGQIYRGKIQLDL